jgi:predicted ATPase
MASAMCGPLGGARLIDSTFVTRAVLQNYKSIAVCDVKLGPLMFLVGPNGSGKSNFLDALRFVKDALRISLDHALREWGGIDQIRRRSPRRSAHFGVRLELKLPSGASGHYAFRIGARPRGGYEVVREECVLRDGGAVAEFTAQAGTASLGGRQLPAPPARLFLAKAANELEFREVHERLSSMAFYNLSPDQMRDLQSPDRGDRLKRDGSNLASVLGRMRDEHPEVKRWVEEYLGVILPSIRGVDARSIGPKETVEFRQSTADEQEQRRFLAANMSDGTLRALGLLVALFHSREGAGSRISLVGIEEPETALGPAALGVLLDSLRDASAATQVIVTSHSSDLLDNDEIDPAAILAVALDRDLTRIGPLDEVDRSVLQEHLFTVGALLSRGQLRAEPGSNGTSTGRGVRLFDGAQV